MASYRNTRALPTAFIIIIMLVVAISLAYIVNLLFFSSGQDIISHVDASRSALISTSADRAVVMRVRGKIVADESFRSYQIKIAPNERTLTTYSGYKDQQIDSIVLGNNIPSYEQFVYALDRVGLMDNNEFTGDSNDTRGICAKGELYEFQILKAEKSIKTLWTTNCSNSRGSLGLKLNTVTSLFINQIPEAKSKIGDIWR